ncbi:MAG: hydantoinase B/oxoprolinase family protein [Deltaproteobacteria bacterium]|nr:hydantoinase B/oxoprolinase family protein [Deltaproteobacteria bacterium]
MADPNKFRFSIDRGGTFTDIYAEVPGQPEYLTLKLLSEDPASYPDAPREGIRRVLQRVTGREYPPEGFDASEVEWIRMGTTVATNALLERQGEPTVLVTTLGFGDALSIGTQARPRIFDLRIEKPEQIYSSVIEADERVMVLHPRAERRPEWKPVTGVTGEELAVLRPLDLPPLEAALAEAHAQGYRSLAVVFMHAYAFPDHELQAGELARRIGFSQVSLSHQVLPAVKLVGRGDTTTVDAYLTPHIRNYLTGFKSGFTCGLRHTRLLFMQSHGGLIDAAEFIGSRAILSGPAGGVVGYSRTGYDPDRPRPLIGFDMGGTSTDVSRYAGALELTHENETAGVRIQAPQMNITTVAAGGGSRLFYRNGMFQVGPQSAGAHPGPVCYRKGGHLALTDANLVLGRIMPERFPRIFGPGQDQPLDLAASRQAMERLAAEINADLAGERAREPYSVEEAALGFIAAANETMARPIREISVARGHDIKEHVLACFGGAGGQHACAISRSLGIREILIHRFGGILSAYGMGMADVVRDLQAPLDSGPATPENLAAIEDRFAGLEREGREQLEAEGLPADRITLKRYLNLRYEGSVTTIMVPCPADGDYQRAFRETHLQEYGFETGAPVLMDDLRVRAVGGSPGLKRLPVEPAAGPPRPLEHTRAYFAGGWRETAVYSWDDLLAGHVVQGPALIIQDGGTIVIEPYCRGVMTEHGDLQITLQEPAAENIAPDTGNSGDIPADPVQLSIFNNLFMSIAEQMGRTLQRTAVSTNIKERLDFSCAIFDSAGALVANAPHIPVHLGAMSQAVREQMRLQGDSLKDGDVLVSNDPHAGGSHLPDITVITPVMNGETPLFFVASRGHHAEIGGITPGSIPPFSHTLAEEGALITSFKLVENGRFQTGGISRLLLMEDTPAPRWGTRRLDDNLYDLKAQVAANNKGVELLREMVTRHGLEMVRAYMEHIQRNAEKAVRDMVRNMAHNMEHNMAGRPAGGTDENSLVLRAVEHMDDGNPIACAISLDEQHGTLHLDFRGTGPQVWGNHNVPPAVVSSVIIYVLRTLIDEDIPLNGGFMTPVTVDIPHPSMLSPSPEAAVVAGNVETSSRITDVLLKAFGAVAGAQGTMNNLTFGDDTFGYYETIGGGSGAGPDWHGKHGVHAHMSNTRITDAEVLERRYPVLVRRFAIRTGSGGAGLFKGGDGVIRELELLREMTCAIVSERRVFAPYGLAGGQPGARGVNLLLRSNGQEIYLGSRNQVPVKAGDRIIIQTPGGGGYGIPATGKG